ncbi:MAG: arsenate reductase [Polaribacter sp.]|jgi:arsenate reductase
MSQVKIYHNPRCSKSRQTLSIIEEQGIEPEIINYLETPPSISELTTVLSLLDLEPQALMRKRESEYKESGLDNLSLSKSEQIQLMVKFPKIIERPIVLSNGKAAIGRPPESVLEIL